MPVEIYLSRHAEEPETEIIDEKDLREDDEVIERIHTDAKTERRKMTRARRRPWKFLRPGMK